MAAIEYLKNAPIKEALIDIQIIPVDDFSISSLEKIATNLSDSYPIQQDIKHSEVGVNIESTDTPTTKISNTVSGRRFISKDRSYVAQFRKNGFTFSRLEPYESWAKMQKEAEKLWNIYCHYFDAKFITRIATRFINVIKLEVPAELSDYFEAHPEVPDSLDNLNLQIDNYLYRMTLSNNDINSFAIVTQAFQGLKQEQPGAEVIFDIDAIIQKQRTFNDPELWKCFESLREFKNEIFFGFITEKTKGLYR